MTNLQTHATVVLLLIASNCAHPPPEARVARVQELGVLEMTDAIQGRDGGYSVLAWGQSIWLYGDTVLESVDEDGSNWHHNSFSLTRDRDASDGIGGFSEIDDSAGAPAHLLAPTESERQYNQAHQQRPDQTCQEQPCGARWATWPADAIHDPERDRVLIFYSKLHAAPGELNFYSVGQSIAVWHGLESLPQRPVFGLDPDHPTLLFPGEEGALGLGVLIEDEHLHAFLCRRHSLDHRCSLARVPLARALSRDEWRFYDGRDWSRERERAAHLFDGGSIMDVSWNQYLERYTAIYTRPLDRDVVLRTAPALTGPWSEELLLFRAESERDIYDALPHSEFAEQDGRVQYITFSRPTGQGWFASEMPIVQVVLERIRSPM